MIQHHLFISDGINQIPNIVYLDRYRNNFCLFLRTCHKEKEEKQAVSDTMKDIITLKPEQ